MRTITAFFLWVGLAVSLGATPAKVLQDLVDQTPAGQTKVIPAGTYVGTVVISRPVVVRAEPGAKLVRSTDASGPTLWIKGSGVTIEGLEVDGAGGGKRQDHPEVLVTATDVNLSRLTITNAWAGLWLDRCTAVRINNLTVKGLAALPFWERGEGVRATASSRIELTDLTMSYASDGIYVEKSSDVSIHSVEVKNARYGLHLMFCQDGDATNLRTLKTVAGIMIMESSRWTVEQCSFLEGSRTGSAGVREIRTKSVRFLNNIIAHHADGIEVLDVRDGFFQGNRILENGVAWTWGSNNSGTEVTGNTHQGNLLDFAGKEPSEKILLVAESAQHHMDQDPPPLNKGPTSRTGPHFDGNFWDSWKGTDLDQDGVGDTPYRFDPQTSARVADHPWSGIFLGSPWSLWSNTIPGGEVIDPHPLARQKS